MSGRPSALRRDEESFRSARLRAPLLVALWALLGFEAVGGLVLFAAELIWGRRPGEALHVILGAVSAGVYAAYQWSHWRRVRPLRARPDYVLGLLAATTLALTLVSGFALAVWWWRDRVVERIAGEVAYPPLLSGVHNIGSMLVLAFVGAHLGAVLLRARSRPPAATPELPLRRGPP